MKLNFPIEIKDKKLKDEIIKLTEKKYGLKVALSELSDLFGEIERERVDWWDKVSDKYDIPESMRGNGELKYNSEKSIITPSDWEDD